MPKVGVIGLGAMGKNHARVYAELRDVELVGVADSDPQLAEDIASKYNVLAFSDYKQLLKRGLDAVSIAVPTSIHRQVALDAAQARASILLEKPIADTVSNAEDIIEAARKNNVKLMIGHVERFNPIVPVIKQELGDADIILIEITRIGPFPPRIKDVGVIIDLAVHDIDLIAYLTGSEFDRVYSLISRNVSQNEDTAILMFEMANGVLARVTVNWLTPFKVREINISTQDKFIKGLFMDQKVFEYSKFEEYDSYVVRELPVPFGEPLRFEIEAFVDAVRNDTKPLISGQDGLKALKMAIRCLDISKDKA